MANAILDAIYAVVKNPQEAEAMAYACGAESNCTPVQNLQGAPAYGPWQIYLPYHPGVTIAQADDPTFAAQYMYDHMNVGSCTAQQGQQWQSDPSGAALAAARCIEGASSAEPYGAPQQANAMAWMTQAAAYTPGANSSPIGANQGKKCTLGWTLPDGSCILPGGSGEGPVNPVDTVLTSGMQLLADHTFWIRALLVIGGLAGVLMGVKGLLNITAIPVPV